MKTSVGLTIGSLFLLTVVGAVSAIAVRGQAPVPERVSASAGKTPAIPQTQAPSPLSFREHPWGGGLPGSWCRRQIVTWTVHEGKRVRTVGETKTTLQSIERDGITLQEVSFVDSGDKRIETNPTSKRFDFFQEPIGEETTVSTGSPTKLLINNMIVPCEKRVYEHLSSSGKRKTTVWYSTQIYPYVLRVERVLRSLPTNKNPEEKILSESTSEVLESSAFSLRKSKLGTYCLQSIRKSGTMTTVTETSCSLHVPGGVIHETMRELDRNGREIRSVETRLINYCFVTPRGVFSNAAPGIPFLGAPVYEPVRPRWRRPYTGVLYPPQTLSP